MNEDDLVQVVMTKDMAKVFEDKCLGKKHTIGDTYLAGPMKFSAGDLPTYIIGVKGNRNIELLTREEGK